DGRRILDQHTLNTTLTSVDHLKKLLNDATLADSGLRVAHQALLRQIEALSQDSLDAPGEGGRKVEETQVEVSVSTYYISVNPKRDILNNGTNTLYLIDDLLSLGAGIVIPFFDGL